MMVLGAFGIGFLLGRGDRSVLLGLGTGQRNIAAAMVVASSSFADPEVMVMVTTSGLVSVLVLAVIAWLAGRGLRFGPPTPPETAASGI
jgi:BASS family bile acid:Na+ symporter